MLTIDIEIAESTVIRETVQIKVNEWKRFASGRQRSCGKLFMKIGKVARVTGIIYWRRRHWSIQYNFRDLPPETPFRLFGCQIDDGDVLPRHTMVCCFPCLHRVSEEINAFLSNHKEICLIYNLICINLTEMSFIIRRTPSEIWHSLT